MFLDFKSLKQRRIVPELMDDLSLNQSEHIRALRGLERLNALSLSDRFIWKSILKFHKDRPLQPLRILDIAAGAGDIMLSLARKAQAKRLSFTFEGCDVNPQAVLYAGERAKLKKFSIPYFVMDALHGSVPERFDIAICSLFLHHLTDKEILLFFKTLLNSSVKMFIFCDLKRSRRGLMLGYLAARLFSRSPVVHFDAPQSVRAALTSGEMMDLACQAGLRGARIHSVWPLRYALTWIRT